jgi:glycosyltransferase involved in cell wall biosynthesis
MSNVKVTIAFATFNEKLHFLKQSVDSVLNQTFKDWEFIVALEPGDTNTDYFKNLAQTHSNIRLIFNETKFGRTGSMVNAMEAASGEYIARLDSDDYCDSTRLQKQVEFLDKNPWCSVVGSYIKLVNYDDKQVADRRYPTDQKGILNYFLKSSSLPGPGVMLRKSDFKEVGYYDRAINHSEDLELWLRGLVHGLKYANIPEFLLYYRVPYTLMGRRIAPDWQSAFRSRQKYWRSLWSPLQYFPSFLFYASLVKCPEKLQRILLEGRLQSSVRRIYKLS